MLCLFFTKTKFNIRTRRLINCALNADPQRKYGNQGNAE
jgi:hypothetical protein